MCTAKTASFKVEDIGLATVYRVLTQFETAGLVARHHFKGSQSVFEINQGEHHDHILCVGCGKVDEFVDEVIEQRQRTIAKKADYVMTNHSLYIYGMCVGNARRKRCKSLALGLSLTGC